jgi:hypothetical protein
VTSSRSEVFNTSDTRTIGYGLYGERHGRCMWEKGGKRRLNLYIKTELGDFKEESSQKLCMAAGAHHIKRLGCSG